MASKKRSHSTEKLARIYDDEVLPVWGQPFGKMLLRGLEVPDKSQVLDVSCGTGYVTVEILRRKSESSRLIAIDGASVLLDVARRKVEKMGAKGVYFRSESAEPRLSFADDVYDVVVCNLGLAEMPDVKRAIADFARVTRPGGEVRCTLPLSGTFQEFYDIYREVLLKHDKQEALARLDAHLRGYPTVEECEQWMRRARLGDARVEVEEFSMLFRSSREFFFAPVIEYGPLARWKNVAGQGQDMQDVFWYIKDAIDAYFSGRAFHVTVKAGCLVGRKLEATDRALDEVEDGATDDDVTGRVDRDELLATGKLDRSSTAVMLHDALADALIESELTVELAMDAEGTVPAYDGTREIDIAEIEEILPDEDLDDEDERRHTTEDGIGLDAFIQGRERPAHLDDD